MWNAANTVIRGKFIALNAFIRNKISNQSKIPQETRKRANQIRKKKKINAFPVFTGNQ